MRFSKLHFALITSLVASAIAPVYSQEQGPTMTDAQRKLFELSASVNSKAQLSRTEVDPKAIDMGSLSRAPVRVPIPSPTAAPTVNETAPNRIAALPATPEKDKSYLEEYNVDWTTWLSTQADRWYYGLKATETMLGLQFVTERPAMIQFTCYADGTIGNVVLKQSSGVPAYDRLQMETLMATQPVPRFPAGTHRTSITLCQGWESHPRQPGESDFQIGSFGKNFPKERVRQWRDGR